MFCPFITSIHYLDFDVHSDAKGLSSTLSECLLFGEKTLNIIHICVCVCVVQYVLVNVPNCTSMADLQYLQYLHTYYIYASINP